MQIDINALHDVIENNPQHEHSGRTFEMLVDAIQRADFGIKSVHIVAATVQQLNWMKNLFIQIAEAMEFEYHIGTKWAICVNNTWFMFDVVGGFLFVDIGNGLCFVDHAAEPIQGLLGWRKIGIEPDLEMLDHMKAFHEHMNDALRSFVIGSSGISKKMRHGTTRMENKQ